CTSNPSKLQAEANENLVLVELSLNSEIPKPESNILVLTLFSLRCLRASATVYTAINSSCVLSQVWKKSFWYMSEYSRPFNCSNNSLNLLLIGKSLLILCYIY